MIFTLSLDDILLEYPSEVPKFFIGVVVEVTTSILFSSLLPLFAESSLLSSSLLCSSSSPLVVISFSRLSNLVNGGKLSVKEKFERNSLGIDNEIKERRREKCEGSK